MNRYIILGILFLSGLLGFVVSFYRYHYSHSFSPDTSLETIHVTQTFHSPVSFVKQLKGDPDAGRKIFKEFCASCHDRHPIIDINAPLIGDKKAWHTLKKLGLPVLLHITIQGIKAMPARGGCFECSDRQLQQTIEYMLNPDAS